MAAETQAKRAFRGVQVPRVPILVVILAAIVIALLVVLVATSPVTDHLGNPVFPEAPSITKRPDGSLTGTYNGWKVSATTIVSSEDPTTSCMMTLSKWNSLGIPGLGTWASVHRKDANGPCTPEGVAGWLEELLSTLELPKDIIRAIITALTTAS